jgi:hypothetical protein
VLKKHIGPTSMAGIFGAKGKARIKGKKNCKYKFLVCSFNIGLKIILLNLYMMHLESSMHLACTDFEPSKTHAI